MGIPALFGHFANKYGNEIIMKSYGRVDNLFFDFNGILHIAGRLAQSASYEDICNSIINYTDYMINKINPQGLVYIAIDGVAPMAKIKQQRLRRYKSVMENTSTISQSSLPVKIDFNMISAGTDFMKFMSNKLKQYYIENSINQQSNLFKVIISDDSEPSEGEHKIINYIRHHIDANSNENSLIYGMDADLIMLTLLLFRKNIDIVREINIFNNDSNVISEPSLLYLNITRLGDFLIDEMTANKIDIFTKQKPIITDEQRRRYILDFILISFFAGNDFLPAFECIKIKMGGLDELIINYTTLDDFIVDFNENDSGNEEWRINMDILSQYLYNLELREETLLSYQKYTRDKPSNNRLYGNKKSSKDNIKDHLMVDYSKIDDQINVKKCGWQERYYQIFFNTTRCGYQEIADEYIKGLHWNLKYYTSKCIECIDWNWSYKYHATTLICDLYQYVTEKSLNSVEIYKQFDWNSEPLSVSLQMFLILPPESFNILPQHLQPYISTVLSELPEYYPPTHSLRLFEYGKQFKWECYPILSTVDENCLNKLKTILSLH